MRQPLPTPAGDIGNESRSRIAFGYSANESRHLLFFSLHARHMRWFSVRCSNLRVLGYSRSCYGDEDDNLVELAHCKVPS